MYREKLIEQIKFFEEKQRHCDILENAAEISKVICSLARKIDELDEKPRTIIVKPDIDYKKFLRAVNKEFENIIKRK